ncbi:MAG: DUF4920 domain-containing protein [Flavobacterium sp.]|nr:DUF4920 domain-containing protein [Flavobacterium sp.]
MILRTFVFSLAVVLTSCKYSASVGDNDVSYSSFGDSITADHAISKEDLFSKYESMKEGDTLKVKFSSQINDVCQKKGCWMNVDLGKGQAAFVKFKDYGFFMPLNAKGEEVVVNGKAFLSIESIEEQKHYAKDAGKSQASIDSITTPLKSYSFVADGVLIKNNEK